MAVSEHNTTLSAHIPELGMTLSEALAADAELVDLWQQLVLTSAQVDAAEERVKAARAAFCKPEWTDAMLSEHAIPTSLGRAPDYKQIHDLNKALLEAACAPFLSGGQPDEVNRLLHSWEVSPSCAPPEIQALIAVNNARWEAFHAVGNQMREEERCSGIEGLEVEFDKIVIKCNGISKKIVNTSNNTVIGKIIRLRAWLIRMADHLDDDNLTNINDDHEIVIDIIRDLERQHANVTAALPHLPLYDKHMVDVLGLEAVRA